MSTPSPKYDMELGWLNTFWFKISAEGGLGATVSPFLLPVGCIFFLGWKMYLHRRKSSGSAADAASSSDDPTAEQLNMQGHRAAGDQIVTIDVD